MDGLVETAKTGTQASEFHFNLAAAQSKGGGAGSYQIPPLILKFTPYLVGAILIFAAIMKLQQLFTGEGSVDHSPGGRWFSIALIEVELVCGMALICGFAMTSFRRFAQVLFAAFLIYSAYQMAFVAKSCGCLGSLEVAPAAIMVLDALLLVALCLWQPLIPESPRVSMVGPIVIVSLAFSPFAWLVAAPVQPVVVVTPALLDLGVLSPPESRQFTLQVQNPRDEAIDIEQIETSCVCLVPTQQALQLSPFQQMNIQFTLDPSKEPGFRGSLLIQITGQLALGQSLMLGQISVEIRD